MAVVAAGPGVGQVAPGTWDASYVEVAGPGEEAFRTQGIAGKRAAGSRLQRQVVVWKSSSLDYIHVVAVVVVESPYSKAWEGHHRLPRVGESL